MTVVGPSGQRIMVGGTSIAAVMLVVGSRGHGGFIGLLLVSVSAYCAEQAICPVVVVRQHPVVTRK